jgi:hypothetical protein
MKRLAADLEIWDTGIVWDEIQYLFINRFGKFWISHVGTRVGLYSSPQWMGIPVWNPRHWETVIVCDGESVR